MKIVYSKRKTYTKPRNTHVIGSVWYESYPKIVDLPDESKEMAIILEGFKDAKANNRELFERCNVVSASDIHTYLIIKTAFCWYVNFVLTEWE